MSFGNTNIKYTVYILNLMSHADLQALFIGFIVLSTGFASTHAFLKLKLSPCITIYFSVFLTECEFLKGRAYICIFGTEHIVDTQ